jgi:hypothetical protein
MSACRYPTAAQVRRLADAAQNVLGRIGGVRFGADGSVTFLDGRAAEAAASAAGETADDALDAWNAGRTQKGSGRGS